MPPKVHRQGVGRIALDAALLRLDALDVELARKAGGKPGKGKVHQVRVASRRLRAALELAEPSWRGDKKIARWLQHLKRLTRKFGRLRDVDVQIAVVEEAVESAPRDGVKDLKRLRKWLLDRRAAGAKELRASDDWFTGARFRKMRKRLVELQQRTRAANEGRPSWSAAAVALRPGWHRMLGVATAAQKPDAADAQHTMRVAAKQFRYRLEVLASLHPRQAKAELKSLERLQSHLGEVHDSALWPEVVRKCRGESHRASAATPEGCAWLLRRVEAHRKRELQQFVTLWRSRQGRSALAALAGSGS